MDIDESETAAQKYAAARQRFSSRFWTVCTWLLMHHFIWTTDDARKISNSRTYMYTETTRQINDMTYFLVLNHFEADV